MNKKPTTPRSRVKNVLRLLWLRSRERAAAIKIWDYRCAECGVKQSVAKGKEVRLQVHHVDGIDWDGIVDLVIARLLPSPEKLLPLCDACHEKKHAHAKT